MKKTAALAALAVTLLALSGCATGPSPEEEVSTLALEESTQSEAGNVTGSEVVDVWEWKQGYAVLVRKDAESTNNGSYSNWTAYWYEPEGKGWALIDDAQASEEYGIPDYPHRAMCVALAPSASEREACLELDE